MYNRNSWIGGGWTFPEQSPAYIVDEDCSRHLCMCTYVCLGVWTCVLRFYVRSGFSESWKATCRYNIYAKVQASTVLAMGINVFLFRCFLNCCVYFDEVATVSAEAVPSTGLRTWKEKPALLACSQPSKHHHRLLWLRSLGWGEVSSHASILVYPNFAVYAFGYARAEGKSYPCECS